MTRINTNVSSLIAQTNLTRSQQSLQTSLTRLSTGLRINSGKDDPAGLIASEVLKSDITATNTAITNSQTAEQLIATADSALGQVSALLNDIRGLVSQAANTGALSADQIAANQLQVDSSLAAIDRVSQTTEFQGKRLLDGSLDFLTTASPTVKANASGTLTSAGVNAAGTLTSTALAGSTTLTGAVGEVSITAKTGGTASNGIEVNFILSTGGTTSSSYDGTLKVLDVVLASGATAASVVAAIGADASSNAAVDASATVAGLFYSAGTTDGTITSGATSGGAAANTLTISASTAGAAYNDVNITFIDDVTAGSETASYSTGSNTLSIHKAASSTGTQVVAAINASNVFSASVSGAGTGLYSAGTTSAVTSSGANANTLTISASTGGSAYNNLNVTFIDDVTAGSETASYSTASNTLSIHKAAGSTTNQIKTAINASNVFSAGVTGSGTGTFAAGTTSAVTANGASYGLSAQTVQINQANFGTASSITAQIDVDTQASKAGLTYDGGALAASLVLEIGGKDGFQNFNFGSGTTIAQIATAINQSTDATGVAARVSGADLILESSDYGTNSFVSAKALSGSFDTTDNNNGAAAATRSTGIDAVVRVNGVQATADGLNISLSTATLDLAFKLNSHLSNSSSFSFDITGGGANFQIGTSVVSNQQARLGIQGVNTGTLGGNDGSLYQLRSGGDKSLATDAKGAAKIVEEVISRVASLRGRLGAFQKTTLDTNINTLTDTLQNLTDAQSSIRDANFAVESANLTRAQVLVQAGTAVLQIANQSPQSVLKLLQ